MKGIPKINKKYLFLFFALICLSFLAACNGVSSNLPVINYFTANPSTVTSGDSSVLSWSVNNATSITINPGNMTFTSSSGSVAVFPTLTTNYTLTATNVEGSVSSSAPVTVNEAPFTQQTITIQPGAGEGKDSHVSSETPNDNYGSSIFPRVGSSYLLDSWSINRCYLQFDLSILPADAVIVAASLKLYQYYTPPPGIILEDHFVDLHRVTGDWEEDTLTWNNQPSFDPIAESTSFNDAETFTWLSWDITSLLQDWVDDEFPNHGVVLKGTDEGTDHTGCLYISSEFPSDSSRHPKLEVTYSVP